MYQDDGVHIGVPQRHLVKESLYDETDKLTYNGETVKVKEKSYDDNIIVYNATLAETRVSAFECFEQTPPVFKEGDTVWYRPTRRKMKVIEAGVTTYTLLDMNVGVKINDVVALILFMKDPFDRPGWKWLNNTQTIRTCDWRPERVTQLPWGREDVLEEHFTPAPNS